MAYSKCVKCENTFFELVENTPANSNFKLLFVQCSRCGTVVGTMDFSNIGTITKNIEAKIDKLKNDLPNINSINGNLNIINQNVEGLYALINSKFPEERKPL